MNTMLCAYDYHAGTLDRDSNATAPTLLAINLSYLPLAPCQDFDNSMTRLRHRLFSVPTL